MFDNPVLLELGMESDIKIFTDIIKKKYPKTNFAYGIGGVKFIIVYSDDSNCKEFCKNIKDKIKKTNNQKYGVEYPMQNPIISEKDASAPGFNSIFLRRENS